MLAVAAHHRRAELNVRMLALELVEPVTAFPQGDILPVAPRTGAMSPFTGTLPRSNRSPAGSGSAVRRPSCRAGRPPSPRDAPGNAT